MSARLLIGDVFERMAELDDGSVDLVLTSPPFLALRSYLPPDHPDKAKEIGAESTPAAFLDTLLRLTAEWRRVLAPHGSICVELGDTYSGSGGAGGDYAEGGLRDGQERFNGAAAKARAHAQKKRTRYPEGLAAQDRSTHLGGPGWPLAKSLCGIPHLYHLSLAYGRNLLTGEPSPAGQWRVRNVVAWCRPNPPVGALGDKFRPATSYMTVACVSGARYFDLDAVRTPSSANTHPRTAKGIASRPNDCKTSPDGNRSTLAIQHTSETAPPLDWWEIPTQPYSGSHYATWPTALCERPIKAMVPQRVCTVCGEPSRRIVDVEPSPIAAEHRQQRTSDAAGAASVVANGRTHMGIERKATTLGWSDCGHDDSWRNGLVLDPFAGSGTTLAVATGHGQDCIGIDLDPRNAELARERVGMFLEVDEGVTA